MGWTWLTAGFSRRFVQNVVLKALILFVLINAVYVIAQPLPWLSRLSLYNVLLPGRERFSYSDQPSQTYSITLDSIEAMFASHVITGTPKANDEYRVLLVGDSSVWGWLLEDDQTLSACLNRGDYFTTDGRPLVAYNMGYPALSAVKDVLILEQGLNYAPDGVVWLVTLQTLLDNEQLRHPILQTNREQALDVITAFNLDLDTSMLSTESSVWERTLIGQRRAVADWLRHQIYGLAWWMTGRDHAVINYIGAPMRNLPESENLLNRDDLQAGELPLAWDVLEAGLELVGDTPILMVNEPIFISDGLNSDVRYNEYYPRWAYDAYRVALAERVADNPYLDLWDAVPASQFTDTPFHYDAAATCAVAEQLAPHILAMVQ
ncbi:MAG: hypothetical protein OHK0046_39340 [Anaerolineae bacterium]